MYGAKERFFFCIDGKIKILIASSLIAPRFYLGKSMERQAFKVLIVFCLEAWERGWFCHPPVVRWRSELEIRPPSKAFVPGRLPCYLLHSGYNLDTIKKDYYRKFPLSMHLKIISLYLRVLPFLVSYVENSIHPINGGVATDNGIAPNNTLNNIMRT